MGFFAVIAALPMMGRFCVRPRQSPKRIEVPSPLASHPPFMLLQAELTWDEFESRYPEHVQAALPYWARLKNQGLLEWRGPCGPLLSELIEASLQKAGLLSPGQQMTLGQAHAAKRVFENMVRAPGCLNDQVHWRFADVLRDDLAIELSDMLPLLTNGSDKDT
ncbi:MAG TPA: hypothetical protein VKX49_12740 [Bryobacteraceae bacterium]|nr:hypothetical protein [Bryobacteraceae bacterium]